MVLRAYAKYLRQAGSTFSQSYIEECLTSNIHIARLLVALFEARFDPNRNAPGGVGSEELIDGLVEEIAGALDAVASLDQDRILRSLLGAGPGHAAHQLLPGRRCRTAEAVRRVQARPAEGARPARPAAEVRDLGLQPPGRGRAPALRPGRPRRAALVRPARGLPHRGARPGQGADGEERRHRAGRRQGRVRRQAPAGRPDRPRGPAGRGHHVLPHVHQRPARHHRQPGHGRRPPAGRAAAAGGAPRRRRHLPGRRCRQGHGDVLRHREPGVARLRLLARRRVRVRRLGRLRPQGDGHHRARRLGVGQAALPRARRRHPDRGLHRRRRRRHVRRRVRQRHAALRAHPPGRGLRPPARLPRPGPGPGRRRTPSAGGCSTCRARRGPTTTAR